MEVYLASCGNVPCDKFDASGAQWFKISQVGKGTNNHGWVQQNQCMLLSSSPSLPPGVLTNVLQLMDSHISSRSLQISLRGGIFFATRSSPSISLRLCMVLSSTLDAFRSTSAVTSPGSLSLMHLFGSLVPIRTPTPESSIPTPSMTMSPTCILALLFSR